MCEFGIDEDPFDSQNQNEEYRVQIIERVAWYSVYLGFRRQWRGEIWSTASPGAPINWTGWILDVAVQNNGVAIPELNDYSRLFFGLGPGVDGGVDVERTGTAYWVYE